MLFSPSSRRASTALARKHSASCVAPASPMLLRLRFRRTSMALTRRHSASRVAPSTPTRFLSRSRYVSVVSLRRHSASCVAPSASMSFMNRSRLVTVALRRRNSTSCVTSAPLYSAKPVPMTWSNSGPGSAVAAATSDRLLSTEHAACCSTGHAALSARTISTRSHFPGSSQGTLDMGRGAQSRCTPLHPPPRSASTMP